MTKNIRLLRQICDYTKAMTKTEILRIISQNSLDSQDILDSPLL